MKRLADILVAGFGLLLLGPILLIIMVVLKIDTGSPIYFIQARPGKNEKSFNLIKFRTMTEKHDQNGALLPDSDRLTRIGKLLRTTSLDELPSLWNVILGDMSLVGPRPLLFRYIPLMSEIERQRHLVKPGITGLAQISGRNTLEWDLRLALDVEYVKTHNFWMDIKILLKTIPKVILGNGVAPDANRVMEDLDEQRRS
jgi:undecaprenyl phosphate N,N'-diacetylbacillosamine 1-phosphate transferase